MREAHASLNVLWRGGVYRLRVSVDVAQVVRTSPPGPVTSYDRRQVIAAGVIYDNAHERWAWEPVDDLLSQYEQEHRKS